MRRLRTTLTSSLDTFFVDMPALGTNRIGASNEREVSVWVPEGADPEGLPLIICLASYLNTGQALVGWRNFGETIPERLDRLIESGQMEPAVVAFVDSYNRLGGNQFVNSPIIGNWVDGLADNLVPVIERRYECGGPGKRGLFGHSSGGYGALYNLAQRPDIWSAAASHAGDCGFNLVYRGELPKALRVLSGYNFNVQAFLDEFWGQEKPKGEQISALMMLAMAASYDPSPDQDDPLGIRLPVTLDTCQMIADRWERWLSFDSLTFTTTHLSAFQSAKLVYVDCGRQDEYNILYGSRQLAAGLEPHCPNFHYEEFDGGHGTIGPRYEVSLPLLVRSLSQLPI